VAVLEAAAERRRNFAAATQRARAGLKLATLQCRVATEIEKTECDICKSEMKSGEVFMQTTCCKTKQMHPTCAVHCLRTSELCPFCRGAKIGFETAPSVSNVAGVTSS